MKKKLSPLEKSFLLWANLLDLGVDCFIAYSKEYSKDKEIYQRLNESFGRQSEEHLRSLYNILKAI